MKIAVALITSLASITLLATPALACPNMDHDDAPATKTADKKPAEKKQEAPKTDKDQKPADTAKTKDTKEQKKGDKVSLK